MNAENNNNNNQTFRYVPNKDTRIVRQLSCLGSQSTVKWDRRSRKNKDTVKCNFIAYSKQPTVNSFYVSIFVNVRQHFMVSHFQNRLKQTAAIRSNSNKSRLNMCDKILISKTNFIKLIFLLELEYPNPNAFYSYQI